MSADLVVYTQSVEESPTSSVMVDKKWLSVIDQNNGSYSSGQSTIETTSLATSDRMMNYKEAYLAVPLVLTAGNSTASNALTLTNASAQTKLMGLKNSYTTLIHSMSVDLNGTNIIQQTPFSEFYNAFNLMTSLSWGDVKTQGSTIGFYPDDALSATAFVGDETSAPANQVVNNRDDVIIAGDKAQTGNPGNVGLNKRLQYINYNADSTVLGGAVTAEKPQSTFLTKAAADTLYKSQVYNTSAGSATESPIIQTQVLAIIKLRHLHNFFCHVPLSRGLQFRFILNFNQCTQSLICNGTKLTGEKSEKSQFGGVVPLMVSSCFTDCGGMGIRAGTGGTAIFDLSVGKSCLNSTLNGVGSTIPSALPASVALHVPSYIMSPSLAGAYVSANSSKRITYTDIYQFKIGDVTAGSTENRLITSGIRGIRSVLMMPMSPSASNGGVVAEHESVLSDAGGGPTSLLAQVTNFQVQIGGVNQIESGGRYEWEIFNNYVYGVNAVNGGMSDGLTSGLVGQSDWARKYLYYYVDCNRGTDLERDTPKSVQVQFQNVSAKTQDYYVYVEFENSFALDVGTGSIVGA